MTTRYYVRLYSEHGGELDSEEVIGGAFNEAIRTLIARCKLDAGDSIRIEADEIED